MTMCGGSCLLHLHNLGGNSDSLKNKFIVACDHASTFSLCFNGCQRSKNIVAQTKGLSSLVLWPFVVTINRAQRKSENRKSVFSHLTLSQQLTVFMTGTLPGAACQLSHSRSSSLLHIHLL